MSEVTEPNVGSLRKNIRQVTGFKPKGGERLDPILESFIRNGESRLFVPWAAPADGRVTIGPEESTVQCTVAAMQRIFENCGSLVFRVMFADKYARRNGFDTVKANEYYDKIRGLWEDNLPSGAKVDFTSASDMLAGEPNPERGFLILESLDTKQRAKIIEAAKKYSPGDDPAEATAEYCDLRNEEAQRVAREGLLWVSLNWPERDAMTGSAPRVYVPESVRTPWLKELIQV